MKKSLFSLASLFAAAAAAAAGNFGTSEPRLASLRTYGQPAKPRSNYSRRGRRYPEQSSRQAMRGHRRAQGGPGIVLVEGMYMRAH